jgi:hypothetical protein
MLISKGYSANDVLCFKLSNGEEVVAKLIEEKSDCFVVSKPCTVVPSQQGIGLMQTLISGELNTNISLNKMHIIMHSPVISDIEKHYIKTTTGLQL